MGCRKDSPISQPYKPDVSKPIDTACDTCQSCKNFPPEGELSYMFYSTGVQYTSPCFNPLNPNEFVCVKNSINLIKYDISTQTETVLCNNLHIVSPPQWGKNGWIVFSVINNVIFKINENGTGLLQLTQGGQTDPTFDNQGNSFICMGSYPNLTSGYRPILDLNGLLIDSVKFTFNQTFTGNPYIPLDVNFNKAFLFYADQSIIQNGSFRQGVCFYQNDTINEINEFYPNYPVLSMCSNSTNIFISFNYDDIKIVDISTGLTTTFIEGCQTKFYNWLSMSPFGDKMLVEKIINTPIVYENGEVAIESKHEIWIIDVNSKVETKILG
jgi:hypothetical protein